MVDEPSFIAVCPDAGCARRNRVRAGRAATAVCGSCGARLCAGLDTLAAARSASFMAKVSVVLDDEDGNPARLIPGQTLVVHAADPAFLRIEAVPDPERAGEVFGGVPFDLFVSDGRRQCEVARASGVHVEGEAAPVLADVTGARGLPSFIAPDALFSEPPLAGFTPIEDERVGTEYASVYARRESGDDGEVEHRLYVSKRTGLPVRFARWYEDAPGDWVEEFRTEFSRWELNPDLRPGLFDPTPPADSRPEPPPPPRHDPALKPGMAPAPLEATDLQGRRVSLEQYAGKVVLLDYWATWCGPCTEEMPSLAAAYERHHRRGFEIIGISLDDVYEIDNLREYLQRKALPWPQVCDGEGFESPLARAYQVGAIPFTLLIGREGLIAAVNLHGDELSEAIARAVEAG